VPVPHAPQHDHGSRIARGPSSYGARELRAAVAAEYDRLAARYDRRWSRYVDRSLAMLRPHLEGRSPGRVLDLGCGTAPIAPRLNAWGAHPASYVGADLSVQMLHAARRRLNDSPRSSVTAAAAEALPFRDGAFDTIVSASSLHYWADPAAGLAEARRVLAPGGRLLLVDWARDRWTMRVMDRVLRIRGAVYLRMYARDEIAALLRDAGFVVHRTAARKITLVWGLVLFEAAATRTRT
jgi:ubiquinone/menaquinone biosynthesis C-methylase UbiE